MIVAIFKTFFIGTFSAILATPVVWFMLFCGGLFIGGNLIFPFFIILLIGFYYIGFETFYHEECIKKEIHSLNKQIKQKPNNLQLYIQRGCAYQKIQKYDAATEDYNYVIRKEPTNLNAYSCLISAYNALKQYDIALNLCYQVINKFSDYHNIYRVMANIKCQKGDYKSAIEDLTYLISIDNQNIEAYQEKTNIYLLYLKDYKNAAISYNYLTQLKPNEPNNYRWCAHCWEKNGDLNQAKENYQKAISLYEKYQSTDHDFYKACKQSLEEINNSFQSQNDRYQQSKSSIDDTTLYDDRYERDFIYWCNKTNYEPDDCGAYDAWIEEKREERSNYFVDDDD